MSYFKGIQQMKYWVFHKFTIILTATKLKYLLSYLNEIQFA